MPELDPPLRSLRASCREMADDLRGRALAVDSDPTDMDRHLESETLAMIRAASTPKRFRTESMAHDFVYNDSCLARVVATVELARGDAGLLTANTGPALAGVAVDALGSEQQQELFYSSLSDGRTWTFFGMTEAERGSDATAMQTRLDKAPSLDPEGGYRLCGAKRYIGNGARGAIGVVFGRTGRHALSINGALVRSSEPGFTGHALDMMGLRGAQISELSFDQIHVPTEMLLGSHLPASRRGMWGASRTFNAMRTQIAAMALGVGYACLDYVREQRPAWTGHEVMGARLGAARALLYDAAATIDLDPDDRRSPSAAKLHATALAVTTTRWAAWALGSGSLLEHPLLEKWCRDVYAFEFMDGTSNILRLHIAQPAAPRREGLAALRKEGKATQ